MSHEQTMLPAWSKAWFQGVGGALVQLAAGELAAAVPETHRSAGRALGKWLINALPKPLIDVAVPLHRRGKKPAMAITSVLLSLRLPAMAATAGAAALLVAWLLPGAGPVR